MPGKVNKKGINRIFTSSERKKNDEILSNVDNIINKMELSLYGTTKKNDSDTLIDQFNDIIKVNINGLNHANGGDITSFMSKLFDQDKRLSWSQPDLESYLNSDNGQVLNYLSDAYRNRVLKYQDLHEISNQLIELREAILVMRDAIVSPDTTEGGIAREFNFDFESDNESMDKITRLENMEKKFGLQKLIKNHIVPKTLTYGTYYAYIIPYSKIFSDFTKRSTDPLNGRNYLADALLVREFTEDKTLMDTFVAESVSEKPNNLLEQSKYRDSYLTEVANDYLSQFSEKDLDFYVNLNKCTRKELVEDVKTEIKGYMNNITVNMNAVPIPVLTEGVESLSELARMNESIRKKDLFTEVSGADKGVYEDPRFKKAQRKAMRDFSDISDCYIKLIDPMHMFPAEIIHTPVGYFYIQDEDVKSSGGILSNTLSFNKYEQNGKQRTIIDTLVNQIVASFDKKFLQNNSELKNIIAEALMCYDLNSKRIKFQFIPAEYVVEFKVNEDENGKGTSMIEPSLFYAKLYLLLLLFKITSIILFSNDQKVNYIKMSGIDKDISNIIQKIAREKQNHQVNITDLMSYTSLLQKIGNGTEMYIPTGRTGDRAFETEILQGQDVQLNTELMELLRNSYILGTGVPSAIMNYLNEADFAKQIETANTKFQGRVMSNQIDFNFGITTFYQKVSYFSKTLDEDDSMSFTVTLSTPKIANNTVKNESLSTFDSIKNMVFALFLGDQWQSDNKKVLIAKELSIKLAKKYLPGINIDEISSWIEEIEPKILKEEMNPSNKNTDNIDDFLNDNNM